MMVKLPIKMYIIILFGVSVILYQYNLSSAVVFNNDPAALVAAAAGQEDDVAMPTTAQPSLPTGKEQTDFKRVKTCVGEQSDLRHVYLITPTYRRPEQIAELTRMSHTLMLVPNLKWIVVEDAYKKSPQVEALLDKSGIDYELLIAPMPEMYKKKLKGSRPRGVSNRNKGLKWLRENAKTGVFYFADDDNTYDLDIFKEIRKTKRVSMFPVGLITSLGVSSPVIRNGKLAGFYDGWIGGRKWPVDMASFAISIEFLLDRPNAIMPYKPGFEEDGFLRSLAPFEHKEIELLASNCTKILVWHTQTKKNNPSLPVNISKYNNTNIVKLKELLV